MSKLSEAFNLANQDFYVTASIGISLFPVHGTDSATLMKYADTAMYRAKAAGRNNYIFYTPEMSQETSSDLGLETDLRRAIDKDELVVHYQPQVDIKTGTIVGTEALVRWNNTERGMVPPMEFIPMAEESDLIIAIGRWVLREVCRQNKTWQDAGLPPTRVSVNISGRQLRGNTLVNDVKHTLQETGLDACYLELEITESSLAQDTESAIAIFDALTEIGVRFSIDDFGTGYSSLAYLKRYPLSALKVDRCFVKDMPGDKDDVAICSAIIAMAHNLNLTVVAEGVEQQAQWDLLREQGCDAIQGNLFSRPLPAQEFAELLSQYSVPCIPEVEDCVSVRYKKQI